MAAIHALDLRLVRAEFRTEAVQGGRGQRPMLGVLAPVLAEEPEEHAGGDEHNFQSDLEERFRLAWRRDWMTWPFVNERRRDLWHRFSSSGSFHPKRRLARARGDDVAAGAGRHLGGEDQRRPARRKIAVASG